jgi:hypothetical protein
MNRLFVAGDSFASIVEQQEIGKSWSEILADKFNLELVNIARPSASNFSIALQIDWISSKIDHGDFAIIFLTDHSRKTLVDLNARKLDKSHPVEYHSKYKTQRPIKHLDLSEEPRLMCTTLFNSKSGSRERDYYRDWFDFEMQFVEDRLSLTGALALLKNKTNKCLVCECGYGKEFSVSPKATPCPTPMFNLKTSKIDVSANTFALDKSQFLNLSSSMLLAWSGPTEYINHIDDLGHQKIAVYLKRYINI